MLHRRPLQSALGRRGHHLLQCTPLCFKQDACNHCRLNYPILNHNYVLGPISYVPMHVKMSIP